MAAPIDFWFSIGSTYTCLTVLRLAQAGQDAPRLRWRPFDVRRIMMAQNNIPFRNKPVKAAYMWRDIARRAQKYGVEVTVPAPYPLTDLALANQIALVGCDEGWCAAYVTETYRLWFSDGLEPGQEPAISRALGAIGEDAGRVMGLAQDAGMVERLKAESDAAMVLGVFGSPSFCVAGEVFWGDDRLEDALDWAERGRLG